MLERYDWKKEEKNYYLSSKEPQLITFPAFKYFSLSGQGNPNDEFFAVYIQCLYSLSYAAKMRWKKETGLDYTINPLELLPKIDLNSLTEEFTLEPYASLWRILVSDKPWSFTKDDIPYSEDKNYIR